VNRDFDFTGRSVLVTGASRGIGRATAVAFAARGARVAVHFGTNRVAADETKRSLAGNEDDHITVPADLADPDAVAAMVDAAVDAFGRLDVLVNNAGVYEMHPIASIDYATWQEAWRHSLAVNLIGAANASFCAARHMIESGGGRIVNVSSRGAFRGEPDAPAYGASKAGMNALGQSLAIALAPHGISVITVAPGWVETDMANVHLDAPGGDEIRHQSPFRRVATADEIAHAVLFAASDGAAHASGAIIDVNGASYLRS
jgi:NAD(P)-dependent dehydrogenase (short-subunit alcohol dehydrogenase family)